MDQSGESSFRLILRLRALKLVQNGRGSYIAPG